MDEVTADYAPKVRDDVAQRIAHMAGIGKGLALDARPYFRLGTSLTSLPVTKALEGCNNYREMAGLPYNKLAPCGGCVNGECQFEGT